MARGKAHDEATKAAVIAALLAGQGVTETAEAYSLPPQVVSDWKKTIPAERFGQLRTEKEESFDQLVSNYLVANFRALKAQAEIASDPAYLKQCSPEGLGVLHGILADKAFRLLEAAARAQGSEQPRPADAPAEN